MDLNKTQRDLLVVLQLKWLECPHLRLGQLLYNFTRFGSGLTEEGKINDIYHYKDEDILFDLNDQERCSQCNQVIKEEHNAK